MWEKSSKETAFDEILEDRGRAVFFKRRRYHVRNFDCLGHGTAHGHPKLRPTQHIDVVVAVSEGDSLALLNAQSAAEPCQCVVLAALAVEDFAEVGQRPRYVEA